MEGGSLEGGVAELVPELPLRRLRVDEEHARGPPLKDEAPCTLEKCKIFLCYLFLFTAMLENCFMESLAD